MYCCYVSIRAHNYFARSYLEEERDSHGDIAEELARVHDHAVHRAIVGFIAAPKRKGHEHTNRDHVTMFSTSTFVESILIPAFVAWYIVHIGQL